MNIEIANRLVNLRKQNNLSQEALAEKLGISRQAVSKWERAEASPDTDNLILLARLYGVSLDELLRTEDEIPMPEENAWNSETETENKEWEHAEKEGERAHVYIGKEGIHVTKDGEQVHVDWNGIHVRDMGSAGERSGWDGIHIIENGEEIYPQQGWAAEPKRRFPTALFICIAYLVIGIVYQAWHPGWLLFLWIPILESLITAVKKRNASCFAYPMAALVFFLSLGIFTGNWMGWIAFLTIPLYYSLVSYVKSLIRHRKWKKQQKKGGM